MQEFIALCAIKRFIKQIMRGATEKISCVLTIAHIVAQRWMEVLIMTECYNCYAKDKCIAAAEPGSVVCMINRMRYGGTHADDRPDREVESFCAYCGKPLKVIGPERFCSNVNCINRYKSV